MQNRCCAFGCFLNNSSKANADELAMILRNFICCGHLLLWKGRQHSYAYIAPKITTATSPSTIWRRLMIMPVFFSFSISLDINNTQQYVISLGCYHLSQLQTLKKITDKNPSLYHLKTCSLILNISLNQYKLVFISL